MGVGGQVSPLMRTLIARRGVCNDSRRSTSGGGGKRDDTEGREGLHDDGRSGPSSGRGGDRGEGGRPMRMSARRLARLTL